MEIAQVDFRNFDKIRASNEDLLSELGMDFADNLRSVPMAAAGYSLTLGIEDGVTSRLLTFAAKGQVESLKS